MKIRLSKKLLSISLALLICVSALPFSMLTASAEGYVINIRNVVYPRPNTAPQADFTAEGTFDYQLFGWIWGDENGNNYTKVGPDEFKSFFTSTMSSYGEEATELNKFIDTQEYSLGLMYVIKNTYLPIGTEITVNYYDENGNLLESNETESIPVSYLKSMMPSGASLPDSLTDNDTLLSFGTSSMMCSPTDHIHTKSKKGYDEDGHWYVCSECGKKILDSDGKHSTSCGRTENWYCKQSATSTQEGIYERRCWCSYPVETVVVPKTGEQTIVTTYDELRDALAKGGKQWIKIGSGIRQQDFESGNTLCVDDPDADITIDLNHLYLQRTTMYDKYMFEIKQGSLRIWQDNGSNIEDTASGMHENIYFSNPNAFTIFNVSEGGSLRLTNVHAIAHINKAYSFSIVRSGGNLRIDSGLYCSDVDAPAVGVHGNCVINGGEFKSYYGYQGEALSTSGNTEINGGDFASYGTAVNVSKNATVVINGGNFKYKNTDDDIYQYCGLSAEGADLTINGGYFYGKEYGLKATDMKSLTIKNGYFKLYDEKSEYNRAALKLYKGSEDTTTIYSGTFVGEKGISTSTDYDFSKLFTKYSVVTDYDTDELIDYNITTTSLGSIDVDCKAPVITHQPKDTHCAIGETPAYIIEADNAKEYIWHVIDENGNELSWSYLSNNGYATPGVRGNTFSLKNSSYWMDGKQVYCEIKGYDGRTVISEVANVKIDKVIKTCNDLYFDDFDQIWNHKTIGDYKNVKTDSNAPYTIGEVSWQMFGKTFSDDSEIYCGDSFNLLIQILPKEGYELDLQGGKLNGIDDADYYHMSDGRQYLRFDISINAPEEYKTQNIELSVEPPVIGQTPATTAVCTAGYAVPGTPTWTPEDATFNSGTEYTVKIPVTAEYAWGDTSTVTAKVNGNDAEFVMEYKGSKFYSYYVVYNFGVPSETKPEPTTETETETTTETEATTETKPSLIIGDVNGDGKVNVLDTTLIQKQIVGLETFTTAQRSVADVNKNGKINILDATLIQKLAAGMISSF